MRSSNILRRSFVKSRIISARLYSDIFPTSEVVIIKKKKPKKVHNLEKEKVPVPEPSNEYKDSKDLRVNEVNIQMVSKNIYEQLFKTPSANVDQNIIKR